MAAGGINAVLDLNTENDTIELHIEETMKGGCNIANRNAVEAMCRAAPDIVRELAELGTVFSLDAKGGIDRRAFGGQSKKRTAYAGASTGKQIVTALNREVRKLEAMGKVKRLLNMSFLSCIIEDGQCGGAVLLNTLTGKAESFAADSVILATGGQNLLFGKTTGSMLCDGTAAATAFTQGARLKNLEMIQFHPTTIETPQKRMLISEAARGEGGRLFYNEDGKRIYFMEDKFGARGNLMPRDVVAREMYTINKKCYLDIAFLGEKLINEKLAEISDLCKKYINLDPSKEPIPVSPSVHYFMGGLDVDLRQETNIKNLFACGECDGSFHGANRLGGNSLLSAYYSGRNAGKYAAQCQGINIADPEKYAAQCRLKLDSVTSEKSKFPSAYLNTSLAETMNRSLGISRNAEALRDGIKDVDFFLDAAKKMRFDVHADIYRCYSAESRLILAKAVLLSALAREESRGAHFREDFPETKPEFEKASYADYNGGDITVSFGKDGAQ